MQFQKHVKLETPPRVPWEDPDRVPDGKKIPSRLSDAGFTSGSLIRSDGFKDIVPGAGVGLALADADPATPPGSVPCSGAALSFKFPLVPLACCLLPVACCLLPVISYVITVANIECHFDCLRAVDARDRFVLVIGATGKPLAIDDAPTTPLLTPGTLVGSSRRATATASGASKASGGESGRRATATASGASKAGGDTTRRSAASGGGGGGSVIAGSSLRTFEEGSMALKDNALPPVQRTGHAGAVLCAVLDKPRGLLVTGGKDCIVKCFAVEVAWLL